MRRGLQLGGNICRDGKRLNHRCLTVADSLGDAPGIFRRHDGVFAEAAVTVDAPAPPPKPPPLLNEGNLINSEWQVTVESYKIKITLGPGGIAYATHPMAKQIMGVDYLEGHWTINYDKIHVSTSFAGTDYSVDLEIVGDKIYYTDPKSKRVSEVQRFR